MKKIHRQFPRIFRFPCYVNIVYSRLRQAGKLKCRYAKRKDYIHKKKNEVRLQKTGTTGNINYVETAMKKTK